MMYFSRMLKDGNVIMEQIWRAIKYCTGLGSYKPCQLFSANEVLHESFDFCVTIK
jgi:hypothetical protein